MKLSIIIPAYNVGKYIAKCLYSCLNQDVRSEDYEIIVVNDGSPDNSLEIAEKIASEAENIHVISQPNGGLSMARNTGLIHAKGKYVWFVDSDDWIETNCLDGLIKCLFVLNVDYLQLQHRLSYDNDSLNRDCYCKINGVVSGCQLLLSGDVIPDPVPFAIYRKEFLIKNKLTFYPGIFHEDSEFKPRVVFLSERCASYDNIVYNYYQRTSGSITSSANPKRAFDCIKVALSIDEFFKNVAMNECANYFHNHISLMINNACAVVGYNMKELSDVLDKNKHLYVHLRKSTKPKYKIEGWLFTVFPKSAVGIYQFLQRFNKSHIIL